MDWKLQERVIATTTSNNVGSVLQQFKGYVRRKTWSSFKIVQPNKP